MKNERLDMMMESVKMRMEREDEEIKRCMKQIKGKAQIDNPNDVAMFMPGIVRELQEALDRKKKYAEQLDMLELLRKNEEA